MFELALCLSIVSFLPIVFLMLMVDHSNHCDFAMYAEIAGANRPSKMVTGLTVAEECAFWGITADEFYARLGE